MQRLLDPFRLDKAPDSPSQRLTRDVFVRLLALVHLLALISLWPQLHGLVGADGILPARAVGVAALRDWGLVELMVRAPSLFWLWPSDAMLHLLCAAGVAMAVGVLAGFLQGPLLLGLWVVTLSLFYPGQLFLSYQWDLLLLEATLLALFVAPWRLRASDAPDPPPLGMTLLWGLLLKLMFLSGLVKLWSGDPAWRDMTALTYHYWTQPLPNPLSWYADALPAVVHRFSTAAALGLELVAPWAMLFGRRGRRVACGGVLLLMGAIALTGNNGYFQLLVATLALTLLVDDDWRALARVPRSSPKPATPPVWRGYLVGGAATFLLVLNALVLDATLRGPEHVARWEQRALLRTRPLRSVNTYGLFARMTTERPEIVLEATADGETWLPYPMRAKPAALDRRPPQVAPHMPRLDWQLWFAALGTCGDNPWVIALQDRLLAGAPAVERLVGGRPFAEPPLAVRAHVYRYRFAPSGQETWWTREGPLAVYCPDRERPR